MKLVDTHCHLGHIEADVSEVLERAREAGVDVVIDIGMGAEESAAAVARAHANHGVYASVGLHPNDLEAYAADRTTAMTRMAKLAVDPGVVAVGETGLDFYRDRWPAELQEEAFREHVALARKTDRALVIHCRDAQARVLEVLDDAGAPERTVMHCFSGDAAYAAECAERGFFCSFAGNLTYPKSHDLREAAGAVPTELLLIETDAPFLAPQAFRGKPNEPALVGHTAAALAEVLRIGEADLARLLRENAGRAFGIPV